LGIHLFNQGEYFEAHEALETAWRDDMSAVRELYQGILQVGVAYHHIQRGNRIGALKMFQRAFARLDHYPPVCRGVDVAKLKQDAGRIHRLLLDTAPEHTARLAAAGFPPVCLLNE